MLLMYSIVALVSGILSTIFAFFVYFRNKGLQNRLFGLLSLSVAIWTFSYWIWLNFSYDNYSVALFWSRMLNFGATLIPVFYVHWIFSILQLHDKKKNLIIFGYLITLFFILFSFSPWYIKDVKQVFFFPFWPQAGIIYTSYIVINYFFYNAIAFYYLIKNFKNSSGFKKNQIKYLLLGSLFGLAGGAFNFPLMYSIEIVHPIGMFFVPFNTVLFAYASIKYRLMNIRLIITRSILYAVLVGAVASFFALSVLLVGNMIGGNSQTSKIITYIINSIIVVIFLDPVKRVWAKITDKIFYKDKIDYQELLQQVGSVVAREIDLQKLLQRATDLLVKKLKIKEISVFIPKDNKFVLVVSSHQNKIKFSLSDKFVSYLDKEKEFVVVEELIRKRDAHNTESDIYKEMDVFIQEAEKLKTEVVVPVIEQDKLNAIFLISSKHSGDLYNDQDIDFFKVFIPQVATAIEKSKLYEEVEQFNIELKQKVEERTRSLKVANTSLEEKNKSLTTIQVITNMISRTLDLNQVNQMIADSVASELGYVGGILSFIDREKNVLKVGAITNNETTREALKLLKKDPREFETKLEEGFNLGSDTALAGRINFSDKMSDFLSPPVKKELIDQIQEKLKIKTSVGVPIFSEAKIIGVIHFLMPIPRAQISSSDIEMMGALTNQVGIVSRNIKLYNTLQRANLDLQEANMRLRELDKAKSEFLSIASHQLRTPISALKGYLSMILEGDFGKVPNNISKVLGDLFESASRLARLINIFLNVSRIESGRLKLEKHPLEISEMIESVIKELRNQAEQKGLKLTYKKPKQKLPMVLADSDKLREVILNLIDNSIKYTPKGSVTTSVEFDDKELRFIVEDTGIGIDPVEAKGLFRKFVRGSGVAQIHTGGSGLGLFIAQKIIKEHGGSVWAESEGKGKGSKFQFVIPLYDGQVGSEVVDQK